VNATLFNSNNYNEADNEIACTLLSSRKRPRELAAADAAAVMNHRQQYHQQHQLLNQSRQPQQQQLDISHYQNHDVAGRLPEVVMPRSTGVSTGLHLTFEDDRVNSTSLASTSGRENVSLPLLSIVGEEDLSAHIQQQSEEIKLLFKAQVVCILFP
jgi:E3 ubiquitin-protein ligase BOI-like protein